MQPASPQDQAKCPSSPRVLRVPDDAPAAIGERVGIITSLWIACDVCSSALYQYPFIGDWDPVLVSCARWVFESLFKALHECVLLHVYASVYF